MTTNYNLLIDQGSTYSRLAIAKTKVGEVVSLRDLTGYTARAQIRKTYASGTAIATFTASVDVATSQISWSLTAAETEAIPHNCLFHQIPKNYSTLLQLPDAIARIAYVWDLELVLGPTVDRYLQGYVLVTPEVTK